MSDIRTGRSFGVLGTGMNDGSVWATANYGKGVLYGATKNQATTATPPVCYPHYMVLMAAPKTKAYTMTSIKVRIGAYDWTANTDLKKPTSPTAATDVDSPVGTGA